jgi:hypothetical protein
LGRLSLWRLQQLLLVLHANLAALSSLSKAGTAWPSTGRLAGHCSTVWG